MKRILSFILSLALLLSLAACAPETPPAPAPAPGSGGTPAPEVSDEPEAVGAYEPDEPSSTRFVRIADGERAHPPHEFSNTHEDGGFMVVVSYVDGTPYGFNDIVYDSDVMEKSRYTWRDPGDDAPGSGHTDMNWLFTPNAPGETEVLLLTDYYAADEVQGRAFHITVDEELRCHLDWYKDGVVGVNYLLYDAADGPPDVSIVED